MAQTNLYFDNKEENIIDKYKRKWRLSKQPVIRRIILEFDKLQNEK